MKTIRSLELAYFIVVIVVCIYFSYTGVDYFEKTNELPSLLYAYAFMHIGFVHWFALRHILPATMNRFLKKSL